MCEVHIIMPLGRKVNKDDLSLMNEYLVQGSRRNRDAWGVMNNKDIFTRQGVYSDGDYKNLKQFVGSPYIIGHNRLGTQGTNPQPIREGEWLIAHNGVFSGYSSYGKKEKSSDTKLFIEDFIKSNKTLAEFMENVRGSYSMFMVNKGTKETFYLKSTSTRFTFFLLQNKKTGSKLLVGSTDDDNIKDYIPSKYSYGFLVPDYEILSEFEPEEETIYKLTKSKGIEEFEKYEYKSSYCNGYYNKSNSKGRSKSSNLNAFDNDLYDNKKACNNLISGPKGGSSSKKNSEIFDHETWEFKDDPNRVLANSKKSKGREWNGGK